MNWSRSVKYKQAEDVEEQKRYRDYPSHVIPIIDSKVDISNLTVSQFQVGAHTAARVVR
jgi:hypothetical protein